MTESWAKLDRKVFRHELFAGDEFSRREAWIWMICNAAWKPHKCRVRDEIIMLERGDLIGARHHLAKAWGWGAEKVRTFLKHLVRENMVKRNQKGNHRITVLTITNYNKFQSMCDGDHHHTNLIITSAQHTSPL